MACEVCEHCHGALSRDKLAVKDGYSYHEKCLKCYVCSETNLQSAEVFKGVIFCSSCSQRIFQGCSTARKTKNSTRGRRSKERSSKRRSHRTDSRRPNGILEMTGIITPSSSPSSKSLSNEDKDNKSLALSTELALQVGKEIYEDKSKKDSVEMGMITEVTQELLKQLKCPVVDETKTSQKKERPIPKYGKRVFQYRIPCSDLRIAELGTSTEIANMALRHKREMPVIIKSNSPNSRVQSPSVDDSGLTIELGTHLDLTSFVVEVNYQIIEETSGQPEEWIDSAYSSLQESVRTHWMDRRLGSILKLPYHAFKRNILNKSSVVSSLMSSSQNKETLASRIKMLFNEDITEHQRRGLKRLYSTINRNKTPCKLGWLDLMGRNNCHSRTIILNSRRKRCKHFRRSQSYRCMRARVMKIAGPTRSELSAFREKVKNFVSPGFLRNITFNNQKYAIMSSQACGNSYAGSKRTSSRVLK